MENYIILDQWIAKDKRVEGRGAIFTTDPEDFKHERKRLPAIWLGVMRAVGKLKLELQLREKETIPTETARAEPIWDGQLIEMTPACKKKKQVWTDRLHLNSRVGDIQSKGYYGPMETYGH